MDDFTVSGATLALVAGKLLERGAAQAYAAVTHGALSGECVERIERSPLRVVLVTDTLEMQANAASSKVRVASVAPLLAEAIRRIHQRESISAVFDDARNGEAVQWRKSPSD